LRAHNYLTISILHMSRKEEARVFYTRVAEATPESEEGKAAIQALQQISDERER
jgi:hypothetical protein